jgi:hypothetical protein
MTTDTTPTPGSSPLLEAILNLSRFHREHEKFYASSPRELAVRLQQHARTLLALADHWSTVAPAATSPFSPYEGAEDLNDAAALQLEGVLFMEGEGRPIEISNLIRDLHTSAEDYAETGEWLATAMQASWDMAATLLDIDELADVLADRHRIIANDWRAATMSSLIARLLDRAADILDAVDFTPAGLRADLAGHRVTPGLLYSAAELISHAADLSSDSAGLVHDNERRWRAFRSRVQAIVDAPA